MECFKKSLVDLISKMGQFQIYDDERGLINVKLYDVLFDFSKYKEVNRRGVYCKWKDEYIQICENQDNLRWLLNEYDWKSNDLFLLYENGNRVQQLSSYYYGHRDVEYKSSIVKKITLVFRSNPDSSSHFDFKLEFNSKEEMLKYMVYYVQKGTLKKPLIQDIKKGNHFYFERHGTVEVVELNDYPSKGTILCRVQKIISDSDVKEKYDIDYSRNGLYYLPYDTPKDDYEKYDYNLNEISLQPHVEVMEKTYNIFWKKMEDASNYIVSMYKVVINYGDREIYHLKDYVIDRNECFLSIDNLVGGKFFFKVFAENRKGEKIAVSRILSPKSCQTPIYFNIESI